MKNKRGIVWKIATAAVCLALTAALIKAPSFAAAPTVYIAGNPDLYPIEYYDSKEQTYCGMMPEIYASISKKTGLQFQYISAGGDSRERMAKNCQAEIISAYVKGEIDPQYIKIRCISRR